MHKLSPSSILYMWMPTLDTTSRTCTWPYIIIYLAHFHLLIDCIKVSLGRRVCHTSHVLDSECIFMTMHDEDNYSIAMYKSIIRTHPIFCQYIV